MPVDEYFPFQKLGLSRNPFGTLEQDAWSDLAWLHPYLLHALETGTRVIQLLGEPGSGKTSALLALKRVLEAQGKTVTYRYLEAGVRPPAVHLEQGSILLLDEIERLAVHNRRRLLISALSHPIRQLKLCISSHQNYEDEFSDAKGDYWKTIVLPEIDPLQLQSLLNARVRAFSTQETAAVWFTLSGAEALLGQFEDDLRKMERALFEAFHMLNEPGGLDREAVLRLLVVSGAPPEPG